MGINVMTGVSLPSEGLSGCDDRCFLPDEGLNGCECYDRCLVTR